MLVVELERSDYVERRENIIAVGNSGTGKSHIALGLGLAACQKGVSVGFMTAAALISASSALAVPALLGLWIDHTGRGGVEITQCGSRLCGHIAWLKDAGNSEECGVQVIGDAKRMGNGTWDRGWIYDPEADSKYDVELKPIGSNKMRVMGYEGTKFLSETMMWKRASVGLTKCAKPGSEKTVTANVSEKAVKTSQKATKEAKPATNKVEAKTANIAPKVKTKATIQKVKSDVTEPQNVETAAKS